MTETYPEPLLPYAAIRTVESERDLLSAAKSIAQFVDRPLRPEDMQVAGDSLQELVVTSMELANENTRTPSGVAKILNTTKTESGKELIQTNVEQAAKKVLVCNGVGRLSTLRLSQLKSREVASALGVYDEANLISNTFWQDFATVSEGALRIPAFLPLLHNRLMQPDGYQFVEHVIPGNSSKASLNAAQRYLGRVIRSYISDPERDSQTVSDVYEQTKSSSAAGPGLKRGLLINAANGALGKYIYAQEGSFIKLDQQFNVLKLVGISVGPGHALSMADIFFRVTSGLRNTYTPHSVRTQQLQQDKYHAEIAGLLQYGKPMSIDIPDIDIAMRFSDAGPSVLNEVRQLVINGESIIKALQKMFPPREPRPESFT